MSKAAQARKNAVLKANPDLVAALNTNHRIVRDIADRFNSNGYLSDKQIALVRRLAAEARNPRPAEPTVPALVTNDRVTFRGQVVSARQMDSQYGVQTKMTVKVQTAEGVWLAWGTVPAALLDQVPPCDQGRVAALRGATVELTTGLKPGREAHFALLVRPQGKLISMAQNDVEIPVAQPVVSMVPDVKELAKELAEAGETETVTGEPANIEF